MSTGDLREAVAVTRSGDRELGRSEDLGGPDACGHGAKEELRRRHPAPAGRAGDLEPRAEAGGHRGQLRARVGMGQAAAHRASAAQLPVSDEGQREPQQRYGGCRSGALDVALSCRGPDPHDLAVTLDRVQTDGSVDVDQGSRTPQPHDQDGHQGLAPGEDLAVAVGGGELGDGVVQGGGPDVGEGGGLHVWLSAP